MLRRKNRWLLKKYEAIAPCFTSTFRKHMGGYGQNVERKVISSCGNDAMLRQVTGLKIQCSTRKVNKVR